MVLHQCLGGAGGPKKLSISVRPYYVTSYGEVDNSPQELEFKKMLCVHQGWWVF
jgi:hypothetical protein